jgi:hypothetical protein
MKRNHAAAVAVCLVGIFTVGVIYILQPESLNISDLSWGVEVGDTYEFDIRAWGESYSGSFTSPQVHPLNDTSITVTVTYLPTFDTVKDAESFSSEIIFRNKINCSFTNGTALDEWVNTIFCEMISGCILPIGAWSSLDRLFPDDTPSGWNPGEDAIATILYNNWFFIEYKWWGLVDQSGGWNGDISLSTGAPFGIVWYYNHGLDEPLTIELTLVE